MRGPRGEVAGKLKRVDGYRRRPHGGILTDENSAAGRTGRIVALVLAGKSAQAVKSQEERVAAYSDGNRHLQQQGGHAIFVPGFVRDSFNRSLGVHNEPPGSRLRVFGLSFFYSKSVRKQPMFLGAMLITRRPEIEQDEGQKQEERDVRVSDVNVGAAGKDQWI